MSRNLSKLNDHLFDQLERLSNKDLDEKQLKMEIERAKSIQSVSQQIVSSAKLSLEAYRITPKKPEGTQPSLPAAVLTEDQQEMQNLLGLGTKSQQG